MPIESNFTPPPSWTQRSIEAMYLPGKGATMRHGMRPPSPDTVAPRGTKAWRDAFNAQRAWMQKQIFAGASLNDLGFDPVRGRGLHAYTALREGDFSPFDSSWNRAARGSERGTYNSVTGAYTPRSAPLPSSVGSTGTPGAPPTAPPTPAPTIFGIPGQASTLIPTPGAGTWPLRRRTLRNLG
jgi:hypothetical protein